MTTTPALWEHGQFYCPICEDWQLGSKHLIGVIADERVRWIANMVTHYRHTHITSWNKMWNGRGGRAYQKAAKFGDYDMEKAQVNERAKRQIIRLCKVFLFHHEINAAHFAQLQHNTTETMRLVLKELPGGQLPDGFIEKLEAAEAKAKEKPVVDEDFIMPWGAHEGTKLGEVPDGYLLWLYENDRMGILKDYITENLDAIKINAGK